MIVNPWTAERTKLLTEWWQEGLSSALIADNFKKHGYEVTRNAIIGKVHRLGLEIHGDKKTKQRTPVRNIRQAARKLLESSKLQSQRIDGLNKIKIVIPRGKLNRGDAAMEKTPKPEKRVLLRKTEDGQCRAIIGYDNGVLADAVCCGEETPWILNDHKLVRSPWCEYHRNRYIQPDGGRKR